MKNSNRRILWLLNHTTLREFEIPLLLSLGFEVYLPKKFPLDETNLSASISDEYDQTLTIPPAILEKLNAHDFYQDPLTPEISQYINHYFKTAFFAFYPHLFTELIDHFHGNLLLKAFGLGTTSYTKVLSEFFDQKIWRKLKAVEKRFWFAQIYDDFANIEGPLLKKRALTFPLGVPDSYFAQKNTWIGDENKILFVCPRIKSSPAYYGKIYHDFKKNFSDLPHVIAGNQLIAVDDPAVTGFKPRDQFNQYLQHCRVMFYHSQEPYHLHYHPIEAILFGMPLIYMRGGILEKLADPTQQPGACQNFKEARVKIEKILKGDQAFIQTILETQSKILLKFQTAYLKPIWEKNLFGKILTPHLPTAKKPITIGVFLPVAYHGGVLRAVKNIAKMLKIGSRADGKKVHVIFSCVANFYDITTEFSDLTEHAISIRETKWKIIESNEYNAVELLADLPSSTKNSTYLLPTDGVCNFSDCDFWLLISDRTFPAIAPLKPYGVIVYDYLQRYIPEYFSPSVEIERIKTVRNAEFVLVTTPQTQNDTIQYAGLRQDKVILIPMEFTLLGTPGHKKPDNSYFIWPTNLALHKNHLTALKALEIYYQENPEPLDIVITGVNTDCFKRHMDKEIHATTCEKKVLACLKNDIIPKHKLHVAGYIGELSYLERLSHAKFLWHPTLIDNGTFSVIEAAYYQVPSLSSDYPQMRYLDEQFKLNLCFSNPRSSRDMAEKLAMMTRDYLQRKALLPTQADLKQFTYPELALEFWKTIQPWLPTF